MESNYNNSTLAENIFFGSVITLLLVRISPNFECSDCSYRSNKISVEQCRTLQLRSQILSTKMSEACTMVHNNTNTTCNVAVISLSHNMLCVLGCSSATRSMFCWHVTLTTDNRQKATVSSFYHTRRTRCYRVLTVTHPIGVRNDSRQDN